MVALCDLNGAQRGKRLPGAHLERVMSGHMRMPISAASIDIWGRDVEENALVFESGDADGVSKPIRDQVIAAPWLGPETGYIPVWSFQENGEPNQIDPRHCLASIVVRLGQQGLTAVVATELEFYLKPLANHVNAPSASDTLSMRCLEDFGGFFDDIYRACEAIDLPADAAISECGQGQFEINLLHRSDALLAADDAVLFKQVVKGVARKHGYAATFMSKPDGLDAGSGMHVHASLVNDQGENVFDDGSALGSPLLQSAIGGLMAAMPECALIFAPHYNSYRRLRPRSHAPTSMCWGYENRTAAIRIPGGAPEARRFEHRVAGADSNPYLVLSALLGAALIGIEDGLTPPPPVSGNSYQAEVPQLPMTWLSAIEAFEAGALTDRIFPAPLKKVFIQIKRQELSRFLDVVSDFEQQTYADLV